MMLTVSAIPWGCRELCRHPDRLRHDHVGGFSICLWAPGAPRVSDREGV